MKLNKNFIVHNSKDEHYIITTGEGGFNGIVKNNDTAAFICDCLKEDTTRDKIADKLLEKYDADREVVLKDIDKVVGKLREIGAIDD